MSTHLYAVESYGARSDAPMRAPSLPRDASSRLIGVIELTDDDVDMALVEAADPETVRASMTAAGWRVDRVTSARWIEPPPSGGVGVLDPSGIVSVPDQAGGEAR